MVRLISRIDRQPCLSAVAPLGRAREGATFGLLWQHILLMGLTYNSYLSSPTKVYGCAKCRTHLTTAEAIMSKSFVGQHGRAILFKEVYVNSRAMLKSGHLTFAAGSLSPSLSLLGSM